MNQSKFKVGNKVWTSLGPLIVRCTIVEIFKFNANDPDSATGYELDEPHYTSWMDYDLFPTFEACYEDFRSHFSDEDWAEFRKSNFNRKYALSRWRTDRSNNELAEVGSWKRAKKRKWLAETFPRKAKRRWVNIASWERPQ